MLCIHIHYLENLKERDRMAKNAKVVTFASTKGGTSKTTTAINFAAYEAHLQKKVLIIDLDYQHDTSMIFNKTDPKLMEKSSIYRAFLHDSKNPRASFPQDFRPVQVASVLPFFADLKYFLLSRYSSFPYNNYSA